MDFMDDHYGLFRTSLTVIRRYQNIHFLALTERKVRELEVRIATL